MKHIAVLMILACLGCQAQRLSQVYYLGVYDPVEQVPAQIYRVRVNGVADGITKVKFASGWVPANFVDSLDSSISEDSKYGRVKMTKGQMKTGLETGRRLVLFGPEGFREAPEGHRLVVIMGGSPEAFFKAIDQSLATISEVNQDQGFEKLKAQLLVAVNDVKTQQTDLVRIGTQNEFDRLAVEAAAKGENR